MTFTATSTSISRSWARYTVPTGPVPTTAFTW